MLSNLYIALKIDLNLIHLWITLSLSLLPQNRQSDDMKWPQTIDTSFVVIGPLVPIFISYSGYRCKIKNI